MADIESRIAEMFQERMGKARTVVSEDDVNHVIQPMGQPEDFLGDEAPEPEKTEEGFESTSSKRLFRDPDDRLVGGVCSGIAHYFGIDPLIIRILFIVAVIFFGTGFLLYLILWAVIPKAITAADKLQMKGRAVTVDNIKKRVQKEADDLKKKIDDSGATSSINSFSSELTSIFSRFGNFLLNIIRYFFKFFGGIIGVSLLAVSILSIFALVLFVLGGEGSIAFSTDGSSIQTSFHQLALYLLDDSGHYWMTAAGVFLLGLFPALLLLVLALVLLGSRYNFKYILLGGLGASVVGFGILIITLTQTQRGFWSEARTQSELVILSNNFDTLSIGLNKVENIW